MKLAIKQENKYIIKDYKNSLIVGNKTILNANLLSDEELYNLGFYRIEYVGSPDPWQNKEREEYNLDNNAKKLIITNIYKNKPLEVIKKQKDEEIKQTYIQLSNEGFKTSKGITLDCRDSDKINWLASKLQNKDMYYIKDYYGDIHEVIREDYMMMIDELEKHYEKLLNDKWKLNTIVKNSDNHQEVTELYWRKGLYDEEDNFIGYEYNPLLE
jgi:nitrogen regulatory protein PII-like uncharacterized protein